MQRQFQNLNPKRNDNKSKQTKGKRYPNSRDNMKVSNWPVQFIEIDQLLFVSLI